MKITIRGLLPGDIPFITSTWLKTYRNASRLKDVTLEGLYFNEHNKLINQSLNTSKILMACDPEDKEHVFGYLVGVNRPYGDFLHYIYTKKVFREQGIAGDLIKQFKSRPIVYNTHENMKGGLVRHLKKNYDSVIFNPYAFTNPNYFEE